MIVGEKRRVGQAIVDPAGPHERRYAASSEVALEARLRPAPSTTLTL